MVPRGDGEGYEPTVMVAGAHSAPGIDSSRGNGFELGISADPHDQGARGAGAMPTPSGGWLEVIAVEPSSGMREEADRWH